MTIQEFLTSRCALFEGLSEETIRHAAAAAEEKNVAAGETIVMRGTTLDGVYVIVSGSVAVTIKTPKGVVEAARLGQGEAFGETSVLENSMAAATIKAGPEGGELLWIPEQAFRDCVAADEELGRRVKTIMSARKQKNSEVAAS